jgi:O-acetyl-ADP-ribose deacetylase
MRVSVFVGDIADAEADALCTSTNPRLSLMMGTGGSVRSRGGFEILKACEEIVEAEVLRSGRGALIAGTAHATAAGQLPHKAILHCVASDTTHHSSPVIIAACVRNAIARALETGCRSIAMPVFASGHARVRFEQSVQTMATELLRAGDILDEITVVVLDSEHASEACAILSWVLRSDVRVRNVRRQEPVQSGWLDYED